MATPPSMRRLIERKKAGEEHTAGELEWICGEHLAGHIPDYQIAAWLMAVCWRGLTVDETLALTRALVRSGDTLEWPPDRPVVDKHSTGGVGDKTTLVLVPLLAAAGLTFVKMSGRGLGYTGGTLDKLESIPGFRVELELDEVRRQAKRIGCALVGQSPALVPADAALYALRDATMTVDSIPLIASSVMSKKLAAGAPAIVLDVKHGSGAFVEAAEAEKLARLMVEIGRRAGRSVRALLSPMDEPLGCAVGNALEVLEAIDVVKGSGPADLRDLTLELGAHLMVLSRSAEDFADARRGLEILLSAGVVADKLEQLIEAQGGDARVVTEPRRLPRATRVLPVPAPGAGWIAAIDAHRVAEAALALGAGRRTKADTIDPAAGVRLLRRRGERIEAGEPFAELHVPRDGEEEARRAMIAGLSLSADPVAAVPPVLTVIE